MLNLKDMTIEVSGEVYCIPVGNSNGVDFVAVRPICEMLGVAFTKQIKKLKNRPDFSCDHMVTTGKDGKSYSMAVLPVDEIGGWLYSINANKVKMDIRPQLIQFQRKLQTVITLNLSGNLTLERIQKLEEENKELRHSVDKITNWFGEVMARNKYLVAQVDSLSREIRVQTRFETSEKKAAASRLSHQRWAKRDREVH